MALLAQSGQVALDAGRYVVKAEGTVDTPRDRERAASVRRHWTRTALERIGAREDDVFACSLGIVSLRDLERAWELHRRNFAELRALVADSSPA